MATTKTHPFPKLTNILLLLIFLVPRPPSSDGRKLSALVEDQPLVLKYHRGPLLKGNTTVNLLWYGQFSPAQRSVVVDFLNSLSNPSAAAAPSVASWWRTTAKYRGGPSTVTVGSQTLNPTRSLGRSLKAPQVEALARASTLGKGNKNHVHVINVVLTATDVAVEGMCRSRCGSHGSGTGGDRFAYAWVGNAESQCPGYCAWPFHQPVYGPQDPPLVAPNGDIGVDGMVINLATVLAGTVTNPFENGYFQGPADAPLEAVSACTGIFGSGAYPGFPGKVLVEKASGASYNAVGVNGRRYLLPAMWDPETGACTTLV